MRGQANLISLEEFRLNSKLQCQTSPENVFKRPIYWLLNFDPNNHRFSDYVQHNISHMVFWKNTRF